jgi:hypothetical protein
MAASEYRTILIAPPPEVEGTIQVEGEFYSDPISYDIDDNFWSINHPLTLVHMALMILEETYRNTEGAKDWEAAIDRVVVPLNMDIVEEEVYGINEMEG